MSGKYSAIITAIDTLVANVSGVKGHFTYEPSQFTVYPSVTISPVGHQESYLSLGVTRREYTFAIRVWGQLDDTNQNTQIAVRDLVDLIIDTLGTQANITIGGSCDYSELTSASFKTVERGSSLYVGEIQLKVQKSYNR